MNALIAEYNAIRGEIIFRATAQSGLLQLNITASGTLAGYVVGSGSDTIAVIIIPVLAPVLGLLWLDHDSSITSLGMFIKYAIKPAYSRVASFRYPEVTDNEAEPARGSGVKISAWMFSTAVAIAFGFLPAAALVFAAFTTKLPFRLMIVPALLAVALLALFFTQFAKRFWMPSR